jgi:hypothetical protein
MPIAYPYKMSDWYGYDRDCTSTRTPYSSSLVQTSQSAACGAAYVQTYHHNGSTQYPIVGDICYTNASGSGLISSGTYRISINGVLVINTIGTVTAVNVCSAFKSFSITVVGTEPFDPCPLTRDQTKYFSGSGTTPALGDAVWDNSDGTGVPQDGWYKTTATTVLRMISGFASSSSACPPPVFPYRASSYNLTPGWVPCNTSSNNFFGYHTGTAGSPEVGNTCYTLGFAYDSYTIRKWWPDNYVELPAVITTGANGVVTSKVICYI